MQYIKVILNGEAADTFGDERLNIAFTKAAADLNDISGRQGSFTYAFELPKSDTNDRLFGYIDHPDAVNKFNRQVPIRAQILVNELNVIDGILKIQELTRDAYKVFVLSESADWASSIGSKQMKYAAPMPPEPAMADYVSGQQLNIEGKTLPRWFYNGFRGGKTMVEQWALGVPDPLVTPLVFAPVLYGKQYQIPTVTQTGADFNFFFFSKESICESYNYLGDNDVNRFEFESLPPFCFVAPLVKAIFETAGWAVSGSIFADENFKTLALPFVGDRPYLWNWGTLLNCAEKRDPFTQTYHAELLGSSDVNNGHYSELHTIGNSPQYFTRKVVWGHSLDTPVNYQILNNYAFQFPQNPSSWGQEFVAPVAGQYRFKFRIQPQQYDIFWQELGPASAPLAFETRLLMQLYKSTEGLDNQDAGYLENGVHSGTNALNVLDFAEITAAGTPAVIAANHLRYTFTGAFVELDTATLFPNGVTLEKGDRVSCTVATLGWSTLVTPPFNRHLNEKDFSSDAAFFEVEYLGVLTDSQLIPADLEVNLTANLPDISCLDFLKSLMQMFNLYAVTDSEKKTVFLETWSKYALRSNQAIELKGMDIGHVKNHPDYAERQLPLKKYNWFEYSEDSKDILVKPPVGKFIYQLTSYLFTDIQQINPLFATSIYRNFGRLASEPANQARIRFLLLTTSEGWNQPSNFSSTTEADWTDVLEENGFDFVPRIVKVRNDMQPTNGLFYFRYWDDVLQVATNVQPSQLPDSEFVETLNFENLFRTYYQEFFTLLTRSSLYILPMFLTYTDYQRIDPRVPVRIGQDFYYVQKIDTFVLSSDQPTRVELIKLV